MGSRPPSPGDDTDPADAYFVQSDASQSFTKGETNYALDFLLRDKTKYMSGNGFKDEAGTDIAKALKEKFPGRPIRKPEVVGNRLRYVKTTFEEYEFVRGKSGVGWDDETKRATAEVDFVQRFTEEHGGKYTKCFKKPCQYYNHLVKLFGGNKATGARTSCIRKIRNAMIDTRSKKSNTSAAHPTSPAAAAPSASLSTSSHHRARAPLNNINNNDPVIDPLLLQDVPSPKPYDNELLTAPAKRSHTMIDINSDDEKKQQPPPKVVARERDHDRSASGNSSSDGHRALRNAETGSQIAHGLKLIGEGMSAPIITKADTSHVDAIVDVVLADPSLLPNDPKGEFYALFLDSLSTNKICARVFIKTVNHVQRIAL
ncbi:hypothetical protein B0H17DRAFT_1194609 [Mycena rosella]|uniref:Myb/SANT-like domain-containing protein n=1 Tax=Mycena rosella TaxID=1033263 RepID=A0AAD7DYI8_MYCRO|nr:hypothetical protein B0H17DRAFT_1194609 [Mycena rosella]